MQSREVLAHKYVKRLFLARFISNYGNGMGPIALAFGILGLPNGSANLLGLVLGTTTVLFLIMAPFGGVIADKYGRTFLANFDRFIMITDDGDVYELPDYDIALAGLSSPAELATLRLAKPLTV